MDSCKRRRVSVIALKEAPDHAAIDRDGGAIYVAGALRGEEGHHGSEFLWGTDAAGGDLASPIGEDGFLFFACTRGDDCGEIVEARRACVAGADVVDCDPVSGVLIRESAGQAGDGGADGIGEEQAVNRLFYGGGRDGDEASPLIFLHARQSFLGEEHGAHQKEVDGSAPVFGICVHEHFRRWAAGIGNANVDSAEAILDGGYELSDGSGICDVDRLVEDVTTAGFLDVSGRFFEFRRAASTDGDIGAFARKFLCDGAAKTFTGGRNDSYAAL